VSIERAQSKKVAIQNSTDNNYELKEKNHILHEELEVLFIKIIFFFFPSFYFFFFFFN